MLSVALLCLHPASCSPPTLPPFPPLATAPVLSPLALYTPNLLENKKSHFYQKLQSIFYGKWAPFILITELICILTKTHDVEGTLKTSVTDLGVALENSQLIYSVTNPNAPPSSTPCRPRAHSVTRKCIILEVLTPLYSSRPQSTSYFQRKAISSNLNNQS